MQKNDKIKTILLISFAILALFVIAYSLSLNEISWRFSISREGFTYHSSHIFDGEVSSIVTANFVIHYSRSSVSEDYVSHLAEFLERALLIYVDKMGFRKPVSYSTDNKIHVYIVDFKDNTLGVTYFRSGPQWTIRKIEIDKDIPIKKLKAVAAHELFHCIQATYNAMTNFGIEDWFLEGSAIAAEDEVFPSSNRYTYFANKWMQEPDVSIISRNYKRGCATLFWKYVWEFLGVETIKDVLVSFARMKNFTGVVNGFGGIDRFKKIFLDFSETNYFKERYKDGGLLLPVKIIREFKLDINYTKIDSVYFYGQDYYVFRSDENIVTINIEPYSNGLFGRIVLLAMNGDIRRIDFMNVSDEFSYTITNFNRYRKCIIIISNFKYNSKVSYRLSVYTFKNLKIELPRGENTIYADPGEKITYYIKIKNLLNLKSEAFLEIDSENCEVSLDEKKLVKEKNIIINPNCEVSIPLHIVAPKELNSKGKIRINIYSSKKGLLKGRLDITIIATGLSIDRVKYVDLANVNTTVKVWVRLVYQFNQKPVRYGVVRESTIGYTAYTNETGWACIPLSSSKVGSQRYMVYGVMDKTYNLTTPVKNATFIITWTCLKIIYSYTDKNATLIGNPINVYVRVVYAHNNEYVKGGVVMVKEFNLYSRINSSGWAHFRLVSNKCLDHIVIVPLSDSYGYITRGIPFKLRIFWSGIDIKVDPSPSFLANIGSNISLLIKPMWTHNSSEVRNCIIYINKSRYILHDEGFIKLTYRRDNISKIFLQIYCEKNNIRSKVVNITLIWTGFKVEMEAVSIYNNLGEPINVKVTILYAHNNAPCKNARILIDDKLKLTNENGTAIFFFNFLSPGVKEISIASVRDEHGVSKIIEGDRSIKLVWTCIYPKYINIYPSLSYVGGEVLISGQLLYAHDDTPARNTVIRVLNKTVVTDSNGMFNITYIPKRIGLLIIDIKVIQNPLGIYKVKMNKTYNITIATEKIYEGLSEIKTAISEGCADNETIKGWSQIIEEISRGNISGASRLIDRIKRKIMINKRVLARINFLNKKIENANKFGLYLIGWEVKEKVKIAETLYREGNYEEALKVLREANMLFRKTINYSLLLISLLTMVTIVFISSRIIVSREIFGD